MKRNMLVVVAGILILAWVTAFGQSLESQEGISEKKQLTASEVLQNIISNALKKKTPIELYPPGYLDWLQKMGDEPMPKQEDMKVTTSQKSGGGMEMYKLFNPLTQKFQVIDLGTFGSSTFATGINNKGQVVGRSSTGSAFRAFRWSNGYMQDLGTLGGVGGLAYGINDSGQVVGMANTSGGTGHAFLWSNGYMQDLGALGGIFSVASGINDSGQVVGNANYSSGGPSHATLWSDGSMQDLGTLGGSTSEAYGINNSGQIVGYSATSTGREHAFLLSNGSMQDLGTLGGNNSYAQCINSIGQIAGYAHISGGQYRAYLWSNGSMQNLGTLGGTRSTAYGINDNGQVVGYAYISSGQTHAFLWSGGSMYDLNSLVDTNISPGWVLQEARGINENGQIVGHGTISGQTRAFLLNPLPEGFENVLATQLPEPVFGQYPTKGSGKDSLVLVTHGWINRLFSPITPSNPDWINGLSNSISSHLSGQGLTNWQVYGYKWIDNAWKVGAPDALANATQEGVNLGSVLSIQGWSHIHLIGHSSGAEVIQEASEWIKSVSSNTTVHCTFLDAYVGNDKAGVTNYGKGSDWSDNYFTHDLFTGSVTEGCLSNAYNVDVKLLDPFKVPGIPKFPSGLGGPVVICEITGSSHKWPYLYYSNTITGNTNIEYEGLGFPLSKEGGNWNFALNNYPTGNVPARVLGTVDCNVVVPLIPLSRPAQVPNFGSLPTVQSISGSVQKYIGSLRMDPGSPVWIGSIINPTNPVNTLSFDMVFMGTNGSDSLLSVYWDTNVIGTVTESKVNPGFQHYSLSFPQAEANGANVLGFRLDPYTNALSSVILTNVAITQIGVSQPFSLSVVSNSNNGLVYELNGEAGFNYVIQSSSNLVNWIETAQLVNTNGTVQFYDQGATNRSQMFYRASALR